MLHACKSLKGSNVCQKKKKKQQLYSIKLFARIFIRGNLAVANMRYGNFFLNSLAFA